MTLHYPQMVGNLLTVCADRRYTDHMKFAGYMGFSFITSLRIILVPFSIPVYMIVSFVLFCLIFKLYILIVMFMPVPVAAQSKA